ncbi:metalloprotease [Chryseobacterium sp. Leaf180]|uniref:T9SS-dependent M36 family metallopeptidase n=1 Tax=Chryseobacterium sp. Leaf180 TaxID=1736289 RepID=UPI0006FA7594|nr:T9SS-dependent M36 family metallopeptidase [Chryseobacterium sp. Leaf180]KQR92406.1 metalloprotease [Chryseobacterium sp. Leaf180]
MKKITLPLLFAVFAIFPTTKVFSQENQRLIKDYITVNQIRDYKKSDLMNFIIDGTDASQTMNGDIVKTQQTYNGLPIRNAVGSVLVKNGKVAYYNDTFVKDYSSASSAVPAITKNQALDKIAADLQNDLVKSFSILNFDEKDRDDNKFAKQRLVYVPHNNELKLAYQFSFPEPKSASYWEVLVDAQNGAIIARNDLNLSCNFYHDAYSHDHSGISATPIAESAAKVFFPENKSENAKFSLLVPANASYNVFALPIEAPTFGSRSVVSNPWILASSPEGWHFDGTSSYTYTRGNNVYAYADPNGTNSVTAVAEGGASRNFDFSYSLYGTPVNNRNASITNLFYLNNKIHDIFYKFGFIESARNFQESNFSFSPIGNGDSVNAEAQDGYLLANPNLNNANFSTPSDGSKPKMQMYLWSTINRIFYYNAPTVAVSRQPGAGIAQFGTALNATGVTGNVQLSSVLDGCTALPAASLTGKIGLVERGSCDFVTKVKNVQNAGATAAIIYNAPTSTSLGNMSGTDATITISSVLISNAEGEYIKNQLAANTVVNVTLKNDPSVAITPDGSFDNGIVVHEYGHGISNRLTGNGFSCLQSGNSKEQMGEGWSDFFALMLTNSPNATATVPRGMATYASGQSITGNGIRPAKYSTSFDVNDYVYDDTNGMEYQNENLVFVPDVHSIGFVWATMLWDLHWEYANKYGYASDVTSSTTSGSARVLQLVTNALKLQPCSPTFVEGRDAILAAELNTTNGADRCMIWRTFARRGLGVGASAGSKLDINDQVQSMSVPADCLLSTSEVNSVKNAISIYPNPAKNEFFINLPSNTMGKVNVEIYDMSGKLVSTEAKISPDAKKAISTSNLVNGTYLVKVKGLGIESTTKVIVSK